MEDQKHFDKMFKNHEERDDLMFKSITEKIEEEFSEIKINLKEIHSEVRKTNGRVRSLEGWRMWVLGGSVVFVPIFSITAGWLVSETLNIPEERASAIEKLRSEIPSVTEAAVNKAFLENINKINVSETNNLK